ncbi:arf-GAP domain and FG repeat-containing protein 1 isoform X2 [Topomyia yanbarensis]|uniref:arf-GAP domain and FG repeat-containing protein 1 isoform X2 n=1 Tax=Topomyia yanbarensis TaxID=2498891 RepID=UPI00273C4A49|nr:arf-GAP domain and FG repeat-containing protein 1 isoform X2 [Topomyia yanbarensis]
MAVVRKKQDDKILKTLRELVGIGGNKQCFDCGQKGPTYINMTIGSFVCTTCSGILRGLTPPHRVKSISMATFTQEEIDFVRQNGNDACSRTWLGLWDPKRAIKQEHRDFMIDKYERKRYYLEPASPLKSLSTNTSNSTSSLPSSNGFSSSSSNISSRNGSENVVPLKTITLTPPTSLRLSRTNSNSSSGLNGNGSHTSSSVTNPSTSVKFQQQFSPDDGNFFSEPPKILPPTPQKHSSNHHQRLNGTVNGANFERNQRNGLLTSTSNGNKFTPDSDFVADFSNANIVNIDGTSNGSNGLRSNNNNRLSNGFNEKEDLSNGRTNSDMENFADFEHNAIYNAAGVPISTSSRSVTVTSAAAPSIDRYAALKDLDDQFREIKLECETNNNHNNNNNIVNGTSNGMINGNHTSDVHQTSTANPFKSANPFQQQQQHQQQSVNWTIPGSASATGTTTNGFYATSPYQNGFTHANLINGNVPNGVSFTNAFHQPSSTAYGSGGLGSQVAPQFNGVTAVSMHQPLNHFGHFGNPFVTAGATTASSNSNNPFL